MKIAFCQLNPIVADVQNNFVKILSVLKLAKAGGADLAIFPELALFGYPPLDLVLSDELVEHCRQSLESLVKSTPLPFILGLPMPCRDGMKRAYNSAAFFDGYDLHFTHKQLLPTYDVFDEARVFSSGPPTKPFSFRGHTFGILICEDGWQCGGYCSETNYAINPVEQLRGVDFIVSINASPYRRGIIELRQKVWCAVSKKVSAPVFVVCQVGANDGIIFDGSSFIAQEDGSAVQIARSFEEDLVYVELGKSSVVIPAKTATSELEQALILGIRDYFQKQGFTKAILGLSGGVDSAVVLIFMVKALGASAVKALYLPTKYNSHLSEEDALYVAKHLKVDLSIIPIERLFEEFLQTLHLCNERAVENIQTRIRQVILMGVSNEEERLMINTSNKSELAMGYTTIYGDLAGAISPLGDLWKEEVYELAKLYVEEGLLKESLLYKPPSAELREHQKDVDTLPPYPILDPILAALIEENTNIKRLVEQSNQTSSFIRGIVTQFDRSEYKRKQGPLVLKVSFKDLRTGRIFPIVQNRVSTLFPRPGQD